MDLAKPAAAEYEQAMANGTPAQRSTVRELNAVIATAETDFGRATTELSQAAHAATLGRAILGDAPSKSGSKAYAQTLKSEIMSSTTATGFDVLARAKVQKL